MKIKINKKNYFNLKKAPLIIAEISGNHCGNKKLFLKHIREAAKNGADLIKIQTYEPEVITLNIKSKFFKIKKGLWKNKYLWELYKKAHTPFKWHQDAFKLAKKLGIILFSSPFSVRAVNFLEKFNTPLYKLASVEITDVNLIRKIAKTKKPIIISTGCASLSDIENCLKIIKKVHNKIILLHCVSKYPTLESEANIGKIKLLKKKFKNTLIGLSDHTNSIHSSLAATAIGIVLIEKHFIINKKIKSEDQKFSIDKDQLRELKDSTTRIHKILSSKVSNEISSKVFRRSIFASKNIKKNEKITKNNIVALRPKVGICASQYFKILNKKSKKNIKRFSPIKKEDISGN